MHVILFLFLWSSFYSLHVHSHILTDVPRSSEVVTLAGTLNNPACQVSARAVYKLLTKQDIDIREKLALKSEEQEIKMAEPSTFCDDAGGDNKVFYAGFGIAEPGSLAVDDRRTFHWFVVQRYPCKTGGGRCVMLYQSYATDVAQSRYTLLEWLQGLKKADNAAVPAIAPRFPMGCEEWKNTFAFAGGLTVEERTTSGTEESTAAIFHAVFNSVVDFDPYWNAKGMEGKRRARLFVVNDHVLETAFLEEAERQLPGYKPAPVNRNTIGRLPRSKFNRQRPL